MIQDENLDELIELIEKLLDFDPEDRRAVRQLSALKEARREATGSVSSVSPTLAKLYQSQGHAQEALEMYEGLIRDSPKPEYLSAAKNLRSSFESEGDEDAVTALRRMLASIQERRRLG